MVNVPLMFSFLAVSSHIDVQQLGVTFFSVRLPA